MPRLINKVSDSRPHRLLSTLEEGLKLAQDLLESKVFGERDVVLDGSDYWETNTAEVFPYQRLVIRVDGLASSINVGINVVRLKELPNAKWQLTESGDIVRH